MFQSLPYWIILPGEITSAMPVLVFLNTVFLILISHLRCRWLSSAFSVEDSLNYFQRDVSTSTGTCLPSSSVDSNGRFAAMLKMMQISLWRKRTFSRFLTNVHVQSIRIARGRRAHSTICGSNRLSARRAWVHKTGYHAGKSINYASGSLDPRAEKKSSACKMTASHATLESEDATPEGCWTHDGWCFWLTEKIRAVKPKWKRGICRVWRPAGNRHKLDTDTRTMRTCFYSGQFHCPEGMLQRRV